jgi:ligand-binding sensor domain-containing protein
MKKIPAIAILLFANLLQAIPQTYDFYHERQYIREDINHEYVNCLLHDSKGFMWFAERVGLHRYDGYSFKSYFHHEPDTSSLSNNQVITMCDDHEKNIWIGTLGGGLNR